MNIVALANTIEEDPPDVLDAPVLNVENLAFLVFPADQIAVVILTTQPTRTIYLPSVFPHYVLFPHVSLPFVSQSLRLIRPHLCLQLIQLPYSLRARRFQ